MEKRILYVCSSYDCRVALPSTREWFDAVQYGHAAVLYNLEQMGWKNLRLGMRDAWCPLSVARHMKNYTPTLVLTNSVVGLHPVIARRLMRRRCGGPIVALWDDYYEDLWRANFGWLAGRFMRWLERRIVVGSDCVITISRHNQRRAEAWGKRAWYIPNGCDVPVYDASCCSVRLEGALKLVYCGDQGRYKRTYEIIAAMAHVPADIRLYMVGTPNPVLQAAASSNVVFLGRVPENDKWSIMSQADVLVCTADTDCNAKFHEYLRMGKPILGYDGVPNCLFTNRRNALLTRDYPAAILELQRAPEWRRTLAENAARDIPVYTWREIAEQYAHAFEEILAGMGNQIVPKCGGDATRSVMT